MADVPKVSFPPPGRYLDHPGDPPVSYKNWFRLFKNYVFMLDVGRPEGSKMTDREKNNYLFALLGAEGVRIMSSHPIADEIDTASFERFSTAVQETFQRPVSIIRACYDFQLRFQGPSETVAEYLCALRTLASDCNFREDEKNRIAVQLAVGCRNKETQKKLLSETAVDFDKFLTILKADESSNENAQIICQPISSVQMVSAKKPYQQSSKATPRQPTFAKNVTCFGCGQNGHYKSAPECRAKMVVCNKCGKQCHFAKVCQNPNFVQRETSNFKNKKKVGTVLYNESETSDDEAYVQSVKTRKQDEFLCTVGVFNGSNFTNKTFEVDSGSDITTLPVSEYEKEFQNYALQPTKMRILNFDQRPVLNVYGYFDTKINFNGRETDVKIFVMPNTFNSVLGKDSMRSLQLQLDSKTMKVYKVKTKSFQEVLRDYPKLTSSNMGEVPNFQHTVKLSEEVKPSVVKLRSVPLARREAVAKEIDSLVKHDILEAVEKSEWVHGMVMVTVPKPNGDVRITTDLSSLNKFVVPDRQLLPNINEILLELRGAKCFTKLDLKKGFFNIVLAKQSRPLTAMITHQGLFQYKRLPMGLKDSAAVFQRCVAQVLTNLPGTIFYVDDILVFGSSSTEHDSNLQKVLKALNDNNLRLNLEKCEYSKEAISFLGHYISHNTIQPMDKNLQPIRDLPVPTTLKEVQRFLGLLNYYNNFLNDFASLAEPLHRLTRKSARFAWSAECEKSFNTLKKLACQKLKVNIFDPNCPTIVTCDASDVGLGATLSQMQKGIEVPIVFSSHTLLPRERNYATNEREAYACVWACENWQKFLLGRHFILRTDHQALRCLLQKFGNSVKSAKFHRWLDRLSMFDFSVEFCKGQNNKAADALSRLEMKTKEFALKNPHDEIVIKRLSQSGVSVERIAEATKRDNVLRKVAKYTKKGWPDKKKVEADLLPFYKIKDELSIENEYLVRADDRIVIPESMQQQLLKMAHDGHPGVIRMKRKMRESFWWVGMCQQVERFVKHCIGCQQSAKSAPPTKVPTGTLPSAASPWKRVAIDISGPFATAPTNERFIVVLLDHFSNFPEILLTGNITSDRIITWLIDVFSRYGNPDELLSDNGPQFVSSEFEDFLSFRDIRHHLTSVYNPQENGQVEVFNRYLKHGAQTFESDGIKWSHGIHKLLMQYRATASTPDGKSPAETFFKRQMRLNFEPVRRPVKKSMQVETTTSSIPKHVGPYKRGVWVLVRRPNVPKGKSPYSKPLQVVEVLGNWSYRLSDGNKWNARLMRRFYSYEDDSWSQVTLPRNVQNEQRPQIRQSMRPTKGIPPKRYPEI